MPSLDTVLTATNETDSSDRLTIPVGFGQGKATFGGLVVGACVRSMEQRVEAERPLRSISAQLLGAPMPGEALIRLRTLRSSGTVTTVAADLEQGGEVMTHVVGVFGKARPVESTWQRLERPTYPAWQSVERLDPDNPFAPEFTRHFEYRSVGAYPFSGALAPVGGYVRPAEPCTRLDGGWLSCLVDTWWLAAFTSMDTIRPAATLTLNAEFHSTMRGLDPALPLIHRGACHWLKDGYGQETRELWGLDGRLLATATELVVIVK